MKRILAALFAVAVVVTGAPAAAAAPVTGPAVTAAATTPIVDVYPSANEVTMGQKPTLTVFLYNTGEASPSGLSVSLYTRAADKTPWKLVTTKTTDSSGVVIFAPTVKLNAQYQVRTKATPQLKAATSTTVRITAIPTLKNIAIASSTKGFTEVGDIRTYKGKTSVELAGKKVEVQGRTDGWTWKTIASATIKNDGTFAIPFKIANPGERTYRVRIPATTKWAAAESSTKTINVYKWWRLETHYGSYPGTIGGVRHANAPGALFLNASSGDIAAYGWIAAGQCRSVNTVVGWEDGSASAGARATFRFRNDVNATHTLAVALGPSRTVTATKSVIGWYYIDMEIAYVGAKGGYGIASFGSPRALCAAPPTPEGAW